MTTNVIINTQAEPHSHGLGQTEVIQLPCVVSIQRFLFHTGGAYQGEHYFHTCWSLEECA
jgi:hypothetical protein